jgi:hypothetical protein
MIHDEDQHRQTKSLGNRVIDATEVWVDVDATSKSLAKAENILASLIKMDARAPLPSLQDTESSGQSESSLPFSVSRSYSRELLSQFLEETHSYTPEESGAVAKTIKQNASLGGLPIPDDRNGDSQMKKKKIKKKKASDEYLLKSFDIQEDWADWKRKDIGGATVPVGSERLSPSTGGDDTPKTRNGGETPESGRPTQAMHSVVLVDVPISPLTQNTAFQGITHNNTLLETHDAVSVKSDITGLTGIFYGTGASSHDAKVAPKKKAKFQKTPIAKVDEVPVVKEKTSKSKRSISFDKVSVRIYERILSANPSCTSGPPVGIGWNYAPEKHYLLDAFELHRMGNRRSKAKLLLTRSVRESMLLELGYKQQDLAQAVRITIRSKNQRKQTVNNLGIAKFEETLESARKGMKSLFTVRREDSLVLGAR